MDKKTVFRASFLAFVAVSLVFLFFAVSDFYGSYADVKSVKFLTVEVDSLRLDSAGNETFLLFDFQISNPAEGKLLIVRHECDLFAEGKHIRRKRSDFSPNELMIAPYGSFTRQMAMGVPSSKLYLFEKGEVQCRIEISVYVRTPFGQTRIPSVHIKTLTVTV